MDKKQKCKAIRNTSVFLKKIQNKAIRILIFKGQCEEASNLFKEKKYTHLNR